MGSAYFMEAQSRRQISTDAIRTVCEICKHLWSSMKHSSHHLRNLCESVRICGSESHYIVLNRKVTYVENKFSLYLACQFKINF